MKVSNAMWEDDDTAWLRSAVGEKLCWAAQPAAQGSCRYSWLLWQVAGSSGTVDSTVLTCRVECSGLGSTRTSWEWGILWFTMGNEASAIQPHAGLSKSEIENLQKTFPKTPTKQLWSPWSEVFEAEQLDVLSKTLVNKTGVISFQNYQQLAGDI